METQPITFQHMTVGDWIITYLLMAIPVVNIILLFVWAFGSGQNPSKASWAKASLIIMAIFLVLSFLLGGLLTAFFSSYMNTGPDFY